MADRSGTPGSTRYLKRLGTNELGYRTQETTTQLMISTTTTNNWQLQQQSDGNPGQRNSASPAAGTAGSEPAATRREEGIGAMGSGSDGRGRAEIPGQPLRDPSPSPAVASASERGRLGAESAPAAHHPVQHHSTSGESSSGPIPRTNDLVDSSTTSETAPISGTESPSNSLDNNHGHTESDAPDSQDGHMNIPHMRVGGSHTPGSTLTQTDEGMGRSSSIAPPGTIHASLPQRSPEGGDTTPPLNRRARRATDRQAKKNAIRIGSLNMNGFESITESGQREIKWGQIQRTMRAQNISILLLQETHLDEARLLHIEKFTASKLKILSSAHPERPTQRGGVAVVLNKSLLHTAGAQATTIVPGRAIQVSVTWQQHELLHVLCVYAPATSDAARSEFYTHLTQYYETHPNFPKPQLMAGDFNNTEDDLDRIPVRRDGTEASIRVLDKLKELLGLMIVDGWRATFPHCSRVRFPPPPCREPQGGIVASSVRVSGRTQA